jgi:hypothetical protein
MSRNCCNFGTSSQLYSEIHQQMMLLQFWEFFKLLWDPDTTTWGTQTLYFSPNWYTQWNRSWGSNISTFHQFRNLVNLVNIQFHLLLQPWTHESTNALQLFHMCFFSFDRKYKPLCLYLWYFNELVMACLFYKPKTCAYISDPPFGCREKLESETSRLEQFSMQWAFLIPTY